MKNTEKLLKQFDILMSFFDKLDKKLFNLEDDIQDEIYALENKHEELVTEKTRVNEARKQIARILGE